MCHRFLAAFFLAGSPSVAAHFSFNDKFLERPHVLQLGSQTEVGQVGTAFSQVALKTLPKSDISSTECRILMCILLCLCCCGGGSVHRLAQIHPALNCLPTLINISIVSYLAISGSFSKLLAGKLQGACWWVCVWSFIQLVGMCIATTVFCVLFGTGVENAALVPMDKEAIKNKAVQHLRREFDKLEHDLPAEERAYYCSAEFKALCDDMFYMADYRLLSAELDMSELRKPILRKYGDVMMKDKNFALAFVENKNSLVELNEFREMMKYFDLKKAQLDDQKLRRITEESTPEASGTSIDC